MANLAPAPANFSYGYEYSGQLLDLHVTLTGQIYNVARWHGNSLGCSSFCIQRRCNVQYDELGRIVGNQVCNVETITAQLTQQAQLQLVMLGATDADNTEHLVMRAIMYLLAKYAGLFLDSRGYEPRDAWA